MTYYDLKRLKKKLDTQKLKVAQAREKSVSTQSNTDGLPHRSGSSDCVGISVGNIMAEEETLNALFMQLSEEIKQIPDEYIRTLIHCRLVKNWSWTHIAHEIGGNNTGNTVRMQCVRFKW